MSKGLLRIAKELQVIPDNTESRNILLKDLRNLVSQHKAFESCTKLERLAEEYNIKIHFCPKYHCELNPIEGLWCESKRFVRKYNEQTFDKLNYLIVQSFEEYKKSSLNVKLWNRFWECLEMYNEGSTYQDVLGSLFGAKHKDKVVSHRENRRFNKYFYQTYFFIKYI